MNWPELVSQFGLPTALLLITMAFVGFALREVWRYIIAQAEKDRVAAETDRIRAQQERDKFFTALADVTAAYREGLEALREEKEKARRR